MRQASASTLVVLTFTLAGAQDRVIGNIYDAKAKYEKALKMISGVKELTVAGINGDLKLVLRVDTEDTKQAVSRLVGSKLDGHPMQVVLTGQKVGSPEAPAPAVAAAPHNPSTCGCPCHRKVGQTVAEPRKPDDKIDLARLNDESYAADECDVIREWLGKPKRVAKNGIRCQQMVGWTNDAKKIDWVKKQNLPHWQSKEMPGLPGAGTEIICYTYIKHRQFCPLGMRQIIDDIYRLTPGKK